MCSFHDCYQWTCEGCQEKTQERLRDPALHQRVVAKAPLDTTPGEKFYLCKECLEFFL
jgi:hypothetical protein